MRLFFFLIAYKILSSSVVTASCQNAIFPERNNRDNAVDSVSCESKWNIVSVEKLGSKNTVCVADEFNVISVKRTFIRWRIVLHQIVNLSDKQRGLLLLGIFFAWLLIYRCQQTRFLACSFPFHSTAIELQASYTLLYISIVV